MARIAFALLLALAVLIRVTILPTFLPLEVLPNLVLVLLLVWSALQGVAEGLVWAFAAGLFLDVVAHDPMGTNGLALLPVVLMAGIARRRFFHSGLIFPIVLAVVATAVHAAVANGLRGAGGGAVAPVGGLARLTLLQALLNALLVPPFYLVAAWMDRVTTERA